jgi:hypothetical protein
MVSVALQQVGCGHIAFAVPAHDRDLPGFGNVATLDDGVAASTRPSGSPGRRSSAFVQERHAPIDACGILLPLALDVERAFHPCNISTKRDK